MKCGQYWPDADKTVEYNDLTIINVEERVEQNYTVRVFILHKVCAYQNKCKKNCQF